MATRKPRKKGGGARRKAGKRLTDELVVKITMARFTLRNGRFPKNEVLAKEFGVTAATIANALRECFSRGLVRLQDVLDETPQIDKPLGQLVMDRFQRLKESRVVQMDPETVAPPGQGALAGGAANGANNHHSFIASDHLHRRLGAAMAGYLVEHGNGLIPDNRSIAIGSGRGVFEAVDAFRRHYSDKTLRARNVLLVPLTGYVDARTHARGIGPLDADFIAHLFTLCFPDAAHVRLGCGIAYSSSNALDKAYKGSPLAWRQPEDVPSHALIGVGVFAPGHRLYEAAASPSFAAATSDCAAAAAKKAATPANHGPPNQPTYVEPVLDDLKTLVALSNKMANKELDPPYYPVADICNRLYFIPPVGPGSDAVNRTPEQEIQVLIAEINSRLLTLKEDQLTKIQGLLIVAGTRAKARALHYFLRREDLNVLCVCTDTEAAKGILSLP